MLSKKYVVTIIATIVLIAFLAAIAIEWNVGQTDTIQEQKVDNPDLLWRLNLTGKERVFWKKVAKRHYKRIRELEDDLAKEKAVSLKTTREILDKQKEINRLQQEVFGEKNKQQSMSSRGEPRVSSPLGQYLGEFQATAYCPCSI